MKLKYAVVFEQIPNNYGAYVPELPGCISTGASWAEIQDNIREAIEFHIDGLQESHVQQRRAERTRRRRSATGDHGRDG